MKKKYFLVIIISFTIIAMNAQFADNMESYTNGQPINIGHWTNWLCGGGAGCAIISSSVHAQGGSLSGLIPGDGSTDALLSLGNKVIGQWGLSFWMYIPSGKEAYLNLQGVVPISAGEWVVGNVFFNQDGANPGVGIIDDAVGAPVNFNFPHDQWFRIVMNWNIASGISLATWQFNVNGVDAIPFGTPYTNASGTPPTSLGGIDFFSFSANTQYWLDTFNYENNFISTTLGINDEEITSFTMYPNPTKDSWNVSVLNSDILSINVFDVLGKKVLSLSPNTRTAVIDGASFKAGLYFAQVKTASGLSSLKLIKK